MSQELSSESHPAPHPEPGLREQGMFPAGDGTPLYYEVWGEGKPIVLCYGLTCRREHWRHQLGYFARHYRVILFDYRGHHRSSIPPNERNLTLEWCARDVEALLDHLNLPEAVCFGHSMGVPVVALAAQRNPRRVRAAILICGSVSNPFEHMFYTDRMTLLFEWLSACYELVPDIVGSAWRFFTRRNPFSFFLTSNFGFNRVRAEEQDILMYMEGVNVTPFPVFHSLLKDYVGFDARGTLSAIGCPTLVVAGDEDWITPLYVQEEIARLLPRGELVRVPGGSHNAHMDYPELVNRKIETFLQEVEYK